MNSSLWYANAPLPSFPVLEGEIQTRVLIIGGGLAGLLCAYYLKQAGVDCVLLEANRICGGTTGHTTAKITSQHGLIYSKLLQNKGHQTALDYLHANEAALLEYRRLCRDIPCSFETKPSYVYTLSHPQRIEEELIALQELGYSAVYEDLLPLPIPTKCAVKFPEQAQFDPLAFAAHIARDLPIYEHSPVRQLQKTAAVTDRGRVRADKLIIATHFPFLNKHGMYFMKLYQQRSYVLALKNAPDPGGMYIGDEENSLSWRTSGDCVLLGGGGHRTGMPGGGWKELTALARQFYPQASPAAHWAAQDCMSLDGMPYIGQYSRSTPDVYVATGFSKWGMTWSMASALILRDLLAGKENAYASTFSPSRSMLTPQLGKNLLHSAGGLLSLKKRRCPHMGCALKWNAQEHTWDCPCHGSRFTTKGKVLDGPANGDIQKRK